MNGENKKREESFGESKKRILSVSTRIKETRCGTVEETHRNGLGFVVEATSTRSATFNEFCRSVLRPLLS